MIISFLKSEAVDIDTSAYKQQVLTSNTGAAHIFETGFSSLQALVQAEGNPNAKIIGDYFYAMTPILELIHKQYPQDTQLGAAIIIRVASIVSDPEISFLPQLLKRRQNFKLFSSFLQKTELSFPSSLVKQADSELQVLESQGMHILEDARRQLYHIKPIDQISFVFESVISEAQVSATIDTLQMLRKVIRAMEPLVVPIYRKYGANEKLFRAIVVRLASRAYDMSSFGYVDDLQSREDFTVLSNLLKSFEKCASGNLLQEADHEIQIMERKSIIPLSW